MGPKYVSNTFKRVMRGMDLPRVRFHDLRHTHISELLLDGHPVITVSKRAGHKSAHMTLDIYGHLLPDPDADMMAAFDKKLEQDKVSKRLIMAGFRDYFCSLKTNPLTIF